MYTLPPMELRVLYGIVQGRTNPGIASQVNLSVGQVNTYLKYLKATTGRKCRIQLALHYLETHVDERQRQKLRETKRVIKFAEKAKALEPLHVTMLDWMVDNPSVSEKDISEKLSFTKIKLFRFFEAACNICGVTGTNRRVKLVFLYALTRSPSVDG